MSGGQLGIRVFHRSGEIAGLALLCRSKGFKVVVHRKVTLIPLYGDDMILVIGYRVVLGSKILERQLLMVFRTGIKAIV